MAYASFTEQFRPSELEQVLGQEKWLEEQGIVCRSIKRGRPASLLFWGPPGTGKTSLATVYIRSFSSQYFDLHPTRFQTGEVKKILEQARSSPLLAPPIIWIDEIHRLTRPQQDLLLRAVEEGTVALVSATTENPSFVLGNALLSRLHVLTFTSLEERHLKKLVARVVEKFPTASFTDRAVQFLVEWAGGDARKLLSAMEPLVELGGAFDEKMVEEKIAFSSSSISAKGEGRFLLISALHKSIRGSDPQAALYWLARLLHGGEDPLYIVRRLIRISVEDVGLADPQAMQISLQAQECYKTLGSPEGELALAEAVVYLALAPKSASCYTAFNEAMELAKKTGHKMPPKHILNAPTKWMKKEGFGKSYQWDHECENAFSGQEYFPEGMKGTSFYEPVERGFERDLSRRLTYFKRLKEKL